MFGIILAIVAIVCCGLALIIDLATKRIGWAIVMGISVILNAYILKIDIEKYHAKQNHEFETTIVKNVVGYNIDSTLTINGADTTKTYTITYWK